MDNLNLTSKGFSGPNGVNAGFTYRPETNDENTCEAVFRDDEYKLQNLKPNPGEIIIDAGAHIGTFSILAAKLFPDTPIIAIEPLPENIELLTKNAIGNKVDRQITIVPRILWSTDDEDRKIFYYEDNSEKKVHQYIAGAYPVVNGILQNRASIVKTITLDTIFKTYNINAVRVFKIDTQASEYEIFAGITELNLLKIQTITGEYQARTPEQDPKPRTKLFQMVASHFIDKSTEPERPTHGAFVFERKT